MFNSAIDWLGISVIQLNNQWTNKDIFKSSEFLLFFEPTNLFSYSIKFNLKAGNLYYK